MNEKTIYALGFFDGVHLGHAALLARVRTLAENGGMSAGVVTFGTHPDTLVAGQAPGLINRPRDREWLLRDRFKMDRIVTLPFDDALRRMGWEAFLEKLRREYGAAGFVCGEDFRFGYRGQGNAGLLSSYCKERGLPWAVVPQQYREGIRVSSTHIRKLLESGDMEKAIEFLGHPYVLRGSVVHGKTLGRQLGFPTANLTFPEGLTVPRFGVYACRAEVDGVRYCAVTNLGTCPTVGGQGITVESWLLDYEGTLYGRELALEFYAFLRPERCFPSLEALKLEMEDNGIQAREYLEAH